MSDTPVVGSVAFELRATTNKLAGDAAAAGEELKSKLPPVSIPLNVDTAPAIHGAQKLEGQIKLNRIQLFELSHVARSVFDSIVAGASPLRALTLESGRIAQVAAEGEGGIAGLGKAIFGMIAPFAGAIGVIGAFAVVIGTATLAFLGFEKSQRDVERALNGLGRASGSSKGQIDGIAAGLSAAGKGSVESIRQLEEALLKTGEIGARALGPATEALKAYQEATGATQAQAIQALGPIFKDPAKGAAELNEKIGFLDQATLRYIQTLQSQGNSQGAIAVAMKALTGALGTQATAWDILAASIGNAFDKLKAYLGAGVAHSLGNFSEAEQLAALQRQKAGKATTADFVGPLDQYAPGSPTAPGSLYTRDKFDQAGADKRREFLEGQVKSRAVAPGNSAAQILQKQIDAADTESAERRNLNDDIKGLRAQLPKAKALGIDPKAVQGGIDADQKRLADLDKKDNREGDKAARDAATAARKGLEQAKASADASFSASQDTLKRQKDELTARAALTGDVQAHAAIEDQIAKIALDEKTIELTKRQTDAEYQFKLKQIDAAALARVKSEVLAGTIAAKVVDELAQELRDRQAYQKALDQNLADRAKIVGYDDQLAEIASSTATTAEERRKIEVAQLDEDRRLERSQTRASLQAEVDSGQRTPASRDTNLAAFDQVTAAKRDQLRQNTQGVGESYADGLNTTIANQRQTLEVGALTGATDALASLATGATDARDALGSFVRGVITDVAKAGIQRFVEKPIADQLFPKTDLPSAAKGSVELGPIETTTATTAVVGLGTAATGAAAALASVATAAGAQSITSGIPGDISAASSPSDLVNLASLIPALGFATGEVGKDGAISGPGTGTSDSISALLGGKPIKVANGESIMTAAATKHFGPMLQAMNKGMTGFATGMVPGLSLPDTSMSPASRGAPTHRSDRGGVSFDLRGAVMTQDLVEQMNAIGAGARNTAIAASVAHTEQRVGAVQRSSARASRSDLTRY